MVIKFKGDGKEYMFTGYEGDTIGLTTTEEDGNVFYVDQEDIIIPENPMIVYRVCSDFDGNEGFNVMVPIGENPADEALAQLGWFIVNDVEDLDDSEDEPECYDHHCKCCCSE